MITQAERTEAFEMFIYKNALTDQARRCPSQALRLVIEAAEKAKAGGCDILNYECLFYDLLSLASLDIGENVSKDEINETLIKYCKMFDDVYNKQFILDLVLYDADEAVRDRFVEAFPHESEEISGGISDFSYPQYMANRTLNQNLIPELRADPDAIEGQRATPGMLLISSGLINISDYKELMSYPSEINAMLSKFPKPEFVYDSFFDVLIVEAIKCLSDQELVSFFRALFDSAHDDRCRVALSLRAKAYMRPSQRAFIIDLILPVLGSDALVGIGAEHAPLNEQVFFTWFMKDSSKIVKDSNFRRWIVDVAPSVSLKSYSIELIIILFSVLPWDGQLEKQDRERVERTVEDVLKMLELDMAGVPTNYQISIMKALSDQAKIDMKLRSHDMKQV